MAEDIKKGFKEPGKEFRGAPFWSWNDDLEDKELARQIKEMDEKDKDLRFRGEEKREGCLAV